MLIGLKGRNRIRRIRIHLKRVGSFAVLRSVEPTYLFRLGDTQPDHKIDEFENPECADTRQHDGNADSRKLVPDLGVVAVNGPNGYGVTGRVLKYRIDQAGRKYACHQSPDSAADAVNPKNV